MLELETLAHRELRTAAALPPGVPYRFDRLSPIASTSVAGLPVQKTTTRTVVTRKCPPFLAKEVVRTETQDGKTVVHHSPELEELVPRYQRYGFDLIAHVGLEYFLRGRMLTDLWNEFRIEQPTANTKFSSFYGLSRKFLFYFGEFHHRSAATIREFLETQDLIVWLIDGTLELGSPVYFGVRDAQSGILLHCRKIPTENFDDLVQCLREAVGRFGRPDRVLHDLSETISLACEEALPGVPHDICHYHLLADIGEDLYEGPQAALSKRLRALKLKPRLTEQRKGQTDWLRKNLDDPTSAQSLQDLLARPADSRSLRSDVLGREVLFAFHSWLFDYERDGARQGFPFDPYLLYFHRRVFQASTAIDRLLQDPAVQALAPKVLTNFAKTLRDYLSDPVVIQAADEYEKAYSIFHRLRKILRLNAKGTCPLSESYSLDPDEKQELRDSLKVYREEVALKAQAAEPSFERRGYQIILEHLDRYAGCLFREEPTQNPSPFRTTSEIEQHWRGTKRRRRKTHGRSKLTADFRALPEEYMLIPNLENPHYTQLLLGDDEALPLALAHAAHLAGPFSHWLEKNHPTNVGRLPRRAIRQQNPIGKLVQAYGEFCHTQMDEKAATG